MEQDSYSEFEPSSNEGVFQDGAEGSRSKMIWSEIGHIVHSNRKPQYSLSSILRRTNLFEEDLSQEEEASSGGSVPRDMLGEMMEMGGGDGSGGSRKSKTLELLQVTDIIKNVHKEEVKIYLEEIAMLRSQILELSKSQMDGIMGQFVRDSDCGEGDVLETSRVESVPTEERGVGTSLELGVEVLGPVSVLPDGGRAKLSDVSVGGVEIFPEPQPEVPSTELLREREEYIKRLEDLNIEIQRQLDVRNEQFSSVSIDLVRQKSLLSRESESLKRSQQSQSDLEKQLKQLLEKVSESERYYMEQSELFARERSSLSDRIQRLESEQAALNSFLADFLEQTKHQVESESILESSYLDILESYPQDSPIWEAHPDLLEFILITNQILQPLKEFALHKKNTRLEDSETQTKSWRPKLESQRISNIFIQSISNPQNYYEDTPINSRYISENTYKRDILSRTCHERNPDLVNSLSATRFRNEINVLKNQLDASKQKLKLKDLENKKLSEEISYLKNKIIRNKTYNSSISNQRLEYIHNENHKLINNLKLNKLSRHENYYSSSKNKFSDENWDEIFSVIQQLKGP
ncbi:hypothetical protein OIY81_2517 [Cryptosporidium canis]|uniref:Uncharacterized protein n=1 Tax=Cryptosporidium canis TaxID=195482 RepID=A0ABQ8P4H8_9CRYT|nr:hypothetical protein OJ252_2702 [Cryptosporidium canis]KAJ1608976.1 hypothetical protein OIY81_2517 [Cryptosporidium canis]